MIHRGSCLCGGVRYEVSVPLSEVVMCHCGMCRKASGTAFATNAPIPEVAFRLTGGSEHLRGYESSPGKVRAFCSRCGSPIYSKSRKQPGVIRLRVGLLDTPVGRKPDFHFMTEFKADWFDVTDGLPQHAGYAPARR